MIVCLDGEFVPEERAVVSVFDRSFLYGDGLFETLRLQAGRPVFWEAHVARLQRGANVLGLALPFDGARLRQLVDQLVALNALPEAVLRLTLSRGVGPPGYSPAGANCPVVVMNLRPLPLWASATRPQWRLVTSSWAVPTTDPLVRLKTCNRLLYVMARAEAETRAADEALLLNAAGEVAEGASSNLFWVTGRTVWTPPLTSGALAGVTREVVIGLCSKGGIACTERAARREALFEADGVFLTLSTLGLVEAVALDGLPLRTSPLVQDLQAGYRQAAESDSCA